MAHNKFNSIFTNSRFNTAEDTHKINENNKLSYWLEKLHIQGEKIREDDNRREHYAKLHSKHNDGYSNSTNNKLRELGENAQVKNSAIKTATDKQVVDDLIKKSNRNIISITSIFPWSIFPNTIYVEESRVTFYFNQFLSSQSHSVDIKDISNVFIESSLLFSSLQVVSRTYVQNNIKIGKLDKKKAIRVKEIIEGLRTLRENNINTSNYEIQDLILKIEEFNTAHTNDS